MESFDELTPQARGRVTGVIYLAYFVLAIVGEVLLQQAGITSLSPNNVSPAALASDLLAHQSWLQAGVAVGLLSTALYVVVTTLFYQLFKSVGATVALLGLAFGLIAMAIAAVAAVFELAPLAVLKSGGGDSLALVVLKMGEQVSPISLLFSGLFQIFMGYLMFRSGFLPRIFGALLALAGVGWLLFLAPPVSDRLLGPIEALGFVAEAGLMLWLLIRGISPGRYRGRAPAARPLANV